MKKIYLSILAFLLLLQHIVFAQSAAKQKISIVVGKVLDAGTAGIALPDGNRIYAKKVATGNGSSNSTDFGAWGKNPAALGGIFNGLNNVNEAEPGSPASGNAITLNEFNGDKTPATFTRISGDPQKLANGTSNKFKNAIGIHIWFDQPVKGGQFLFVDLDGLSSTNGEWVSAFGFNAATLVAPAISFGTNTLLGKINNPALDPAWNTMVSNADNTSASIQTFRTSGNTGTPENPVVVSKSKNVEGDAGDNSFDPDNTRTQVLFDFGTSTVDHFFALWGINDDPGNSSSQNSGMSAFIAEILPDFGDAPDTYGTLYASGGASHGIFSTLKLGAAEDAELTGDPASLADNDADDDGLTSPKGISFSSAAAAVSIPGYSINVNVNNGTGKAATLVAWIDWNADGIFQASEAVSMSNIASVPDGTTQSVTLSWTNQTLTHLAGRDYAILRLRLSTDAALTTSKWAGALTDGEVEDYSLAFPANSALPLNFVSFSAANNNNNTAVLKWSTANEMNCDKVDIQSSVNGLDFTTVSSVPSTGNGNRATTSYGYSDINISRYNSEIAYYRLKQIDLDGKYYYSSIVAVRISGTSKSTVRPTVVQKGTAVTINVKGTGTQNKITVFSSAGQVVLQKSTVPGSFTLETANLQPGTYYIKINTEEMQKLIVQ